MSPHIMKYLPKQRFLTYFVMSLWVKVNFSVYCSTNCIPAVIVGGFTCCCFCEMAFQQAAKSNFKTFYFKFIRAKNQLFIYF